MVKRILLLALFCISFVNAQVGIGTTTPKSSLDITISDSANPSSTDGLLIPRIDVFPTINPTVDQQGMLVYLTTTTGIDLPGFYYWNNTTTTWVNINSDTKTYLEDVDSDTKVQVEESADEDLVRFDIAGTEYFRMEAGRLQVSNTNNNVFYGNDAGDLAATGVKNIAIGSESLINLTTGSYNIGIGDDVLKEFTVGRGNIGIGSRAMNYKISGESNIVLGRDGLHRNTTGSNNIVMGSFALKENVTGSSNIAIGQSALMDNLAGRSNVAIGAYAGRRNLGAKSVFLGNTAGAYETESFRLYIDNSNTTTPLIYGEFDNNLLRVNGTLDVNNAYQFPTTDGTAGQVLATDGAGTVVWSSDVTGTDDQNITGSGLSGTNLTIGIEGGISQVIDVSSLQDGTGTDDQSISGSGLSGTNLTIGIEGGTSEVIDVSSLQDGTGTDDQNISGSGLSGTSLTIGIEGGTSEVIDVSSLQNGAFKLDGGVVKPNSTVNIATDDFVFGSTQLNDDGNFNHYSRFYFDKSKGAFRAGETYQDEWDETNVGDYSFAMGYRTKASGSKSAAWGNYAQATGTYSTAWGWTNTASGELSTVFGYRNSAYGSGATSWGYQTRAGDLATAFGINTNASGALSASWGEDTEALSYVETAFGSFSTSYTPNSTGDWNAADRLLVIGNGVDDTNRSNALTLLKNGDLGLGTDVPTAKLDIRPGDNDKGVYINYDKTTTGTTYGLQIDLDNTAGTSNTIYGAYIDALKNGATNNTVYGVYGRGRDYQTGTGTRTTYGVRGYSYVSSTNGTTNSRGIYGSTSNNGDNEFGGYFAGDVYATGTYQTSDRKLKRNIKAYSGALEKLTQLDIKSYDFKTKEFQYLNLPEGEQVGLIAQDLQKVFPGMVKRADETTQLVPREDAINAKWSYREVGDQEMVEVGKDVEILAVNYTNLVPVLIQATKEQQEIIEEQNTTIDNQGNQIRILEERLEKIEQILLKK